jgi:hypothetical protein
LIRARIVTKKRIIVNENVKCSKPPCGQQCSVLPSQSHSPLKQFASV